MDHRGDAEEDELEVDLASAGPSSSLLPGDHNQTNSNSRRRAGDMTLTAGGKLRAYYLGVVVCLGGFLCNAFRGFLCGSGADLTPSWL